MVDYNNFAKTFSNSRKNMRWEEIDYFLEKIKNNLELKVLDIGCGSGRLLEQFSNTFDIKKIDYLGLDLSSEMLKLAKQNFGEKEFLNLNMLNIDKIPKLSPFLKGSTGNVMEGEGLFNNIFFIASFHHLDNLKDREEVIKKAYNLLEKGGKIFMTNWALNSEVNNEKYKKAVINKSENNFGSTDYNIVFGENDRYYHCFNLDELKYLSEKTNFKIIENRLFDNKKNFITILEK